MGRPKKIRMNEIDRRMRYIAQDFKGIQRYIEGLRNPGYHSDLGSQAEIKALLIKEIGYLQGDLKDLEGDLQ